MNLAQFKPLAWNPLAGAAGAYVAESLDGTAELLVEREGSALLGFAVCTRTGNVLAAVQVTAADLKRIQ